MNIVLAFDKFKGSLTAREVIEAVETGLLEVRPNLSIQSFQLADGGEGSLEVFAKANDCITKEITTQNAIGIPHRGFVGFNPSSKVAVIEMAQHAGLASLEPDLRNPLKTTTYGVGEAIRQVTLWGALEVIVCVGGSATNDGGAGMLQALGYQFLDKTGNLLIPCGCNLEEIDQILAPESFKKIKMILASDVTNPLFGTNGATYCYAPQKGATQADLPVLERGLQHLADKIQVLTGQKITETQGYGAAGGFPLCACEVLHATIQSGSQLISEHLGVEKSVAKADLIITGEGKIDEQTSFGKAITPTLNWAEAQQKKVILVCGTFDAQDAGLSKIDRYELTQIAEELSLNSFRDAFQLGIEAGRRIATSLKN